MYHLVLAGNMLRAIDGTQALYNKNFLPKYPSTILYDKIPVKLRPAAEPGLDSFVKVSCHLVFLLQVYISLLD
jgi:Ferritin-like